MLPKLPLKATNNSQLVNQWLSNRQAVIVAFNNLCGYRPFALANVSAVEEALQEFCFLLVDYVSLGHFEVFEHISDSIDKCGYAHFGIPQRVLQCLMNTTVAALDFNEKYQQQAQLLSLEEDLGSIGLAFAQRLEWEDQMIAQYHLAKNSAPRVARSA